MKTKRFIKILSLTLILIAVWQSAVFAAGGIRKGNPFGEYIRNQFLRRFAVSRAGDIGNPFAQLRV